MGLGDSPALVGTCGSHDDSFCVCSAFGFDRWKEEGSMKKEKKFVKDAHVNLIRRLSRHLSELDHISLEFLELDKLTCHRRLGLNEAVRALKREVIFAQTELWNAILKEDRDQVSLALENAMQFNRPSTPTKPKGKKR
jgi:hypothetical protein